MLCCCSVAACVTATALCLLSLRRVFVQFAKGREGWMPRAMAMAMAAMAAAGSPGAGSPGRRTVRVDSVRRTRLTAGPWFPGRRREEDAQVSRPAGRQQATAGVSGASAPRLCVSSVCVLFRLAAAVHVCSPGARPVLRGDRDSVAGVAGLWVGDSPGARPGPYSGGGRRSSAPTGRGGDASSASWPFGLSSS